MVVFKNKRNKKDLGRSPEQSRIIIQQEYQSELMLEGNYETIARDAFVGNPDGYSVVDRVASSIASLKFKVYRQLSNGSKKYLPNHEILDLLKKPNSERGQYEYLYELAMFFLLSGKMWQRKITVNGKPKKLFACNPRNMGMYLGQDAQRGWIFDYNGNKIYYKKDELSYLKLPHPLNEFDGLSPLQSAGYAIDGNNASDKWNFSMIKNGARPSGVLKTPNALSDTTFSRLQKMIKGWMGVYNAGKGIILENGVEWQQMSLSQKDMDNYNYTKLNSRKIAQVLGVPVALIDPDSQTYANYKEGNRAFHIDKVIPAGQRIVDEWNNWLMPFYENIFIEIDKESIEALKDDEEKTADISRKDYEAGIITRYEAREARGREASEEDKVYKVKLQDVFISTNGEITIPAMELNVGASDVIADEEKSTLDLINSVVKKKNSKNNFSVAAAISILDALDVTELHDDVKMMYLEIISEEGLRTLKEVLNLTSTFKIDDAINEYIEENVLKNCTTILDETLRSKIEKTLIEGTSNNETLEDLKLRMSNIFEEQYFIQTYSNQLEVIARTESLTATSVASQQAYGQSGVVESQEWLTTLDGREREWHDELNGKVTKLDEYFVNGKGRLKFPRDSNGSAENVIQCRCSTAPVVKGQKQLYDTIEKKEALWRSQDEEALKYTDAMKENYDKAFRKQLDNLLKAIDNL